VVAKIGNSLANFSFAECKKISGTADVGGVIGEMSERSTDLSVSGEEG
jgi:hypothetical protein